MREITARDRARHGALNEGNAELLGIASAGWTKLAEFTKAGSYTWTAPDLFGGKPYKIGVLVVGGGGSGGAASNTSEGRYEGNASGGASGYAESFLLEVTPAQSFPVVVGAGGAAAAVTYGAVAGKNGGSSGFNGVTANGGSGGNADVSSNAKATGAYGGQCSANAWDDTAGNLYGGVVVPSINYNGHVTSRGCPSCCINPFEGRRILGAGGFSRASSTSTSNQGGKSPITKCGGGTGYNAASGAASGGKATEAGSGGGAATTYGNAAATSGAGADGAVYLYVQGVAE